jgi:hypothetical protein
MGWECWGFPVVFITLKQVYGLVVATNFLHSIVASVSDP